ncbi:CCA tRNA nucleotidyltransferase [Maritimibacter dapengensis]|uniref:CCA tRNA nucleotidyltransferase n=1 Tax=Maritimibacter dapengensis TaxID=2836868 RepID=A0ABS6T484_9RHOB|nr:CCA tRNA nucleotidyltransferase [Maritimibacter dapengensis]MBV7380052.1 CCA tRNA nucleotidyltransferase [Maritimibacter dapengensis]
MSPGRIEADWIEAPVSQAVCAMLTEAGYEAHFVGGCVRNALMDKPVTDLDITTNARPEMVTKLAEKAGFHPVPTGIEHGTITVVAEDTPFEITTWRRDVDTDGRRAVVVFADRLEDDAHRRDFTMNALYAEPDGTLVDPLGGYTDLKARRVRFIDDAHARIREDFLRILRFFRFHAWYGNEDEGLDPDALAAIAELSEGIKTLSRERIGAEMLKLLAAPDPAPAVAAMEHTGALGQVMTGLTTVALAPLVHFEEEAGAKPAALRRLAVLGGTDHREALRLSKVDDRQLGLLLAHRGDPQPPAALGYRLGRDTALDVVLLNAALLESPLPPNLTAEIARGAEARFPLSAADLMPRHEGAALGATLKRLEADWIASDFALDRQSLMDRA